MKWATAMAAGRGQTANRGAPTPRSGRPEVSPRASRGTRVGHVDAVLLLLSVNVVPSRVDARDRSRCMRSCAETSRFSCEWSQAGSIPAREIGGLSEIKEGPS